MVADAAYGCGAFAGLGDGMTTTTRAKVNATFYRPAQDRRRSSPPRARLRVGVPPSRRGKRDVQERFAVLRGYRNMRGPRVMVLGPRRLDSAGAKAMGAGRWEPLDLAELGW
jgi:hypothetical protein